MEMRREFEVPALPRAAISNLPASMYQQMSKCHFNMNVVLIWCL